MSWVYHNRYFNFRPNFPYWKWGTLNWYCWDLVWWNSVLIANLMWGRFSCGWCGRGGGSWSPHKGAIPWMMTGWSNDCITRWQHMCNNGAYSRYNPVYLYSLIRHCSPQGIVALCLPTARPAIALWPKRAWWHVC